MYTYVACMYSLYACIFFLCMHGCMHVCMHACLCVCMHICMCMCMHVYFFMHMYKYYIYINLQSFFLNLRFLPALASVYGNSIVLERTVDGMWRRRRTMTHRWNRRWFRGRWERLASVVEGSH